VITEALHVLLLGVLGVFLVMALIYVVVVALSRIRVPSSAGATESNLMNGLVAAPSEQPSDFQPAGAAEPIGVDDVAVEHMVPADDWYEQDEYDDEISGYGYEFSEHDSEFDNDDEYEYVVEEYYLDSELGDADQYTDAEDSRSPQIVEVTP